MRRSSLIVIFAVICSASPVFSDAPEKRHARTTAALKKLQISHAQTGGIERIVYKTSDDDASNEYQKLLESIARTDTVDPTSLVTNLASNNVGLAQKRAAQKNGKETTISVDTFLLRNEKAFDLNAKKGKLSKPVDAVVATPFGTEKLSGTQTSIRHTGITYRVAVGTSVQAVAPGLVVFAQNFEGFGLTVIIDHGRDVHSIYAHLDATNLVRGDEIPADSRVGQSGASGSFDGAKLYFELRMKGEPVDPIEYMSK